MLSAKDLLTDYQQAEQRQRAEQNYISLEKRRDKRKQADLDAGRLVRIRLDCPGDEPNVALYPARVAAYACRLLGPALPSAKGGVRVVLTSQGRLSAAYYPEYQVYLAILALRAHARTVVRRQLRRYRACPATKPPLF